MVVVKVSPKVILSCGGLAPVPGLLNVQVRAVHVGHVPSVSELGEFCCRTEGGLAEIVSCGIAGNVDAAHWIGNCDDAASPSLIEGLVGIAVGSEVGIVVIEGAIEHPWMNDAENWQLLSAGGVSELRVASIAGHPTHETVLLRGPDSRLESQSLLIRIPLPVI